MTSRLVRAGTVAIVAAGLVAVGAPSAADTQDAVDRARKASTGTNYTGAVTVRWADSRGPHSATMDVRSAGGVVRVDGQAKAVATPSSRWLYRDGNWDLMSPPNLGSFPVPAPVKYQATTSAGPTVAGRPTALVVLTVDGRPEERWYQDTATGLVLRREQLSARGDVVRSVGFDRITVEPPGATPGPAPEKSLDLRPQQASGAKKPYVAPASLPGGYRRVGLFNRAGALQVVYSDGLHGLSMFEQAGRLDTGSMPAGGQPVKIGSHNGYQWAYSGGQVVVWHAGGTTYTVIGDGAPEDVAGAARGVKARARTALDRLRQASAKVMQAVSGAG
jgi:hypothetical protein